MRTIKDSSKKPELQTRADIEKPPEDAKSNKNTPSRKWKTDKSLKDDHSSLNDSGSQMANHLLEKSSLIGVDEMFNISSLKCTPPNKRNVGSAVSKTFEINEKKKVTKKGKSSESPKDCENDKKRFNEKQCHNEKQRLVKPAVGSEFHEKQDFTAAVDKAEAKKKLQVLKKNGLVKDTERIDESPYKNKTGRKRKLSEVLTCTTECSKDVGGEQTRNTNNKTKPTSKEKEKHNLKRQTKELRKTQSEKRQYKRSNSPNKQILEMKNILLIEPEINSDSGIVSDIVSNEHENTDNTQDSVKGENGDKVTTSSCSTNCAGQYGSENEDSISSDMDTSFAGINSVKQVTNNKDEQFPKSENIVTSAKRDKPKHDQIIKCDLCGHESHNKGGYTRHLRKCQPEKFGIIVDASVKPRFYSCKQCEYTATKWALVINHMQTHEIYQCQRCKFHANSGKCLKEHSAQEHKYKSDRKFCKSCNRYVKCNEIPLEKHMEDCQDRVPFKCLECSKAFKYKPALKCHVNSDYPDQPKLFSCTQCDHKSNYKANHIQHIHEQSGERNIKCPDCEELFHTEGIMGQHQKLHPMAVYKKSHFDRPVDAHKDNRTHFCTFATCAKAFRTAKALKEHGLVHTDEKPFNCEHCSYTFRQKRYVKFHMKRKHPELVLNDLTSSKLSMTESQSLVVLNCDLHHVNAEIKVQTVNAPIEKPCDKGIIENNKLAETIVRETENLLVHSTNDSILASENGHLTKIYVPLSANSYHVDTHDHNANGQIEKYLSASKLDGNIMSSSAEPILNNAKQKKKECLQVQVIESHPTKMKEADRYDFQSEEESGDDMKQGFLHREYDIDKLPLPPVDACWHANFKFSLPQIDAHFKSVHHHVAAVIKKQVVGDVNRGKKIRKKPGPKPKSNHRGFDTEYKQLKRQGRMKNSELEEKDQESRDSNRLEKYQKNKRSLKVIKYVDNEIDEEFLEVAVKKKRNTKLKSKPKEVKVVKSTPKNRGRKKKVLDVNETEVVPENGDATINYSEVESGELFGNSQNSIPDHVKTILESVVQVSEKTLQILNETTHDGNKIDSDEANACKITLNKSEYKKSSEGESSDIISDFDEDLEPPPAPRPPPIYDSEYGDIESGPENEELNAMSNEPLRDFESSRDIYIEKSKQIDDNMKTSEYINSIEAVHFRDQVRTPASVIPYQIDSVTSDHENPLSNHSVAPHTPYHSSVPATPIASCVLHDSSGPGERIIKNSVHKQVDDESIEDNSMPEVDKDYVGRFFEEIQCVQTSQETQISRSNDDIDENSKSQDKIMTALYSDSGVPSSLASNQTEDSIQMQSPPEDLSHQRKNLIVPDTVSAYQPRSKSSHNRSLERITSMSTYDMQYNALNSYCSTLPPRDTISQQTEPLKIPSASNASAGYFRFVEGEAMLQRQQMSTLYDHDLQNLHHLAEAPLPQHSCPSPLLRHMHGGDGMLPSDAGTAGAMLRHPFHSPWTNQDVHPTYWGHPAYSQQQTCSPSSSPVFGNDSSLLGKEFMFDPSRAAAEMNMFSSLALSHNQQPDFTQDTCQFDNFNVGNDFASHGYGTASSLPMEYTCSALSSSQRSLDECHHQPVTGIRDFQALPPGSSASDMYGTNSSFNFEKLYSRDSMYHPQHLNSNTENPFLPAGMAQHSMFDQDCHQHSFYVQNSPCPFMNNKNYLVTTGKFGSASDSFAPQRDFISVSCPNVTVPDGQLQEPYRHPSSMIYNMNMMNKYY